MAVQKIDYEDKVQLQNDENIPDKNKVTDEDMNQIKSKVNNNADELTTAQQDINNLQEGQGTASGDITNLKNRVTILEGDNTKNKQDIANKVDKVEGKGLSTEDYTTAEKQKLAGLSNYNDTEIKQDIQELQTDVSDIKTEQETQNDLLQRTQNALINITTEKSSNINVKDSSDLNAKVDVFGNSIQNGEPTPEAPVDIENVEGNVDVILTNENLILNGYSTPKTDTDFWDTVSSSFIPLENGWGKYSFNNTGASTVYLNSFIKIDKFKNIIKPDAQYKLLVEFKNVQMTDTENKDYFQITGGTSLEFFKDYIIYKTNDIKNNLKFSTILNANSNINNYKYLFRSFATVNPGNSVSLEVRIALLEANSSQTEIFINNQEITFPLQEGQKLYEGDYLANDGIHHVRKQIELDGTESITSYSRTYETGYAYRIIIPGGIKPNSSLYCTKYKNITFSEFYNTTTNIIGKCSCHNTLNQFVYFGSSKSTLEEFKQEIAGSILEYELLEEEIEAYTPEQQEVYNRLQNVLSYKTVTNVFTDKALLEFKYIADTQTWVLNKLNNTNQQVLNLAGGN